MTKKVAIIGADAVGSLEALLLVTLFDNLNIDVIDKKPGIYSQRRRTIRHGTMHHVIETLTALKKAKLAEGDQFAADKIRSTILFLRTHFLGLATDVTLSEQAMCALLKKQALKLARINRKVLKAKKTVPGKLEFHFNTDISPNTLTRMTSNKKQAAYEAIFAADGASSMVRGELFPDDIEQQPPGLNYKLEVKFKKTDATKRIHYAKPNVQDGLLHYWESESDGTSTLHIFMNEALYAQIYAVKGIVKQDDGQLSTNRLAKLPPTLQLFVMQQIEKVVGDKKLHADSLQMIAKPLYLQSSRDSSKELNASQVMLVGSAELGFLLDDEDINLGFISAVEKAQAYYQTKAHAVKLGEEITRGLLAGYIMRAELNIEKQYNRSLKRVKHHLIGGLKKIESNIIVVWPHPGTDLSRLERTIELFAIAHKDELHKYADWLYQADKMVATLYKMRNDPKFLNLSDQKRKVQFDGLALATEFAQMIAGSIDSQQCKRQAKIEMYTNNFLQIMLKPTYQQRGAFNGKIGHAYNDLNFFQTMIKPTDHQSEAASDKTPQAHHALPKDIEVDALIPALVMKRMASLLLATQSLLAAEEVAHQFDRALTSLVKPQHAEIKQHLIALEKKMATEFPVGDPRQAIILRHFTTITNKLAQGKLKSLSLEAELSILDAKLFGKPPLSSGLRAFIGFVLGAIAGFLAGLAVTAACSITGPLAPVIGAAAGAAVFGSVGFFTKKSAMKKYEAKKQSALRQWGFAAEFNAVKADFRAKLHQSHNSPKIRNR